MFSILGYENWQMTITFFCVHKHKTLTFFLSEQEMFLQLSIAEFLEYLLQENAKSFTTLEPFITHDPLWVANELNYKNPSDIASYFSQVYLYLAANIYPSL
jgi:hypothetical protein